MRWLALAWTLAIVIGCSIPGDSLPESVLLSFDKVLHLMAFVGFGALWLSARPHASRNVLIGGVLLAVFTEVYQHVMPIGRSFDLFDILADTVGLCLGVALGWLWMHRASLSRRPKVRL